MHRVVPELPEDGPESLATAVAARARSASSVAEERAGQSERLETTPIRGFETGLAALLNHRRSGHQRRQVAPGVLADGLLVGARRARRGG